MCSNTVRMTILMGKVIKVLICCLRLSVSCHLSLAIDRNAVAT